LFGADMIRAAREAVLRPLAQRGLWKDDGWHLDAMPRPQWPATGLKTRKVIGHKHPEVAALLETPALRGIIDALLEGVPFDRSVHGRAQILFTLPNATTWTVPDGWHVDGPRLASRKSAGVQLFTFLDTVERGGGGTLVVSGSQRLANDGRFMRNADLARALRRAPFFKRLYSHVPDGQRLAWMEETAMVGDVAVKLVELTGEPGDAWLVALGALHSGAPNASSRPRMMMTCRFVRTDVMDEMVDGYGWKKKPADS
jgi:hypothetical protein